MVTYHGHTPTRLTRLTRHVQLCLAHYCDLHGPTPLMVTEGLPVPCSRCYDDTEPDRPHIDATVSPPAAVTEALRRMSLSASLGSKPATSATQTTGASTATPPQSSVTFPEGGRESRGGKIRQDSTSTFRRTYDQDVAKRAIPCKNCALTLPERQNTKADPGEKESTDSKESKDSSNDPRGPTLKTRAPYARVYGSRDNSPPSSNPMSSNASDVDEDTSSKSDGQHSTEGRPTTCLSQSSLPSSKLGTDTHTHYLDYFSTHEPQVASTYSIIRASCLRTLSFETLPRRPEHNVASPPSGLSGSRLTMPPPSSSFTPYHVGHPAYSSSVPSTPQSAGAGGCIFFGDATAGYTTAYIFRVPDMHARGRKRVYALMALSTHRESVSMKAFNFVSVAFQNLASWIQELAEEEAERERERDGVGPPLAFHGSAYAAYGPGPGVGRNTAAGDSDVRLGLDGGSTERDRVRDGGSSFLAAGGARTSFAQRMGGSIGPGGFSPKARGLAEVVGLPDFFIELHAQFVQLLLELGVQLGV